MAEVLIQDLDPVVLEKLETLAKKHGRRRVRAACPFGTQRLVVRHRYKRS